MTQQTESKPSVKPVGQAVLHTEPTPTPSPTPEPPEKW